MRREEHLMPDRREEQKAPAPERPNAPRRGNILTIPPGTHNIGWRGVGSDGPPPTGPAPEKGRRA
jgi:hypothetical protein